MALIGPVSGSPFVVTSARAGNAGERPAVRHRAPGIGEHTQDYCPGLR